MNPILETVLGSRSATQTLLFLQAYGSGHASRIAATYDVPLNPIYMQLRRLETGGVLVSRMVGRTRVFEFDPRNPTVRHLRDFLDAELELLPDELVKKFYRQRQRPRRTGKGT